MHALLNTIATLPVCKSAQRLFHGRGGKFPGCEHLSLDIYPPALVLTSFAPLADDALQTIGDALQARWQQGQWWIGPDAFFFEEGTAVQYEQARYGEFRLQPDGATLLVGLRDQALKPIGHTRPAW